MKYIEEELDEEGFIKFKCSCGFIFKCGIIVLERHCIFCPKCDKESKVRPETHLAEYYCPVLEDYIDNKEVSEIDANGE